MGGCSATGCSSRNERGKKLHCFPRDPVRREIWEKMVGRRNWKAHDSSRLCEDHFEESQYESRRMDNLRKLKPNAVPTKFTHFPQNKTLNKTQVQFPVLERHSVEHSYSQSVEKEPSDTEDSDPFSVDEDPVENILKPECFGLPLHCEFLCVLDDQDFTAAQCDTSEEPQLKGADEHCECVEPETQYSTPVENTDSVDCKIAHLKNIIRKKDERILMLLKAVVKERREKHKLEREKQNLIQNIEKVFNANQMERLEQKSDRGVKWSIETMEKARQLLATCGVQGYMLLRAQNQPLPSLRCLKKRTSVKNKRLEQDAASEEEAPTELADCLQTTVGLNGPCVAMVMQ